MGEVSALGAEVEGPLSHGLSRDSSPYGGAKASFLYTVKLQYPALLSVIVSPSPEKAKAFSCFPVAQYWFF